MVLPPLEFPKAHSTESVGVGAVMLREAELCWACKYETFLVQVS